MPGTEINHSKNHYFGLREPQNDMDCFEPSYNFSVLCMKLKTKTKTIVNLLNQILKTAQ